MHFINAYVLVSYLFSVGVTFITLGWAYSVTCSPSVLVYLAWRLYVSLGSALVQKNIIDSHINVALHSNPSPDYGRWISLYSTLESVIGALIFSWLVVSLIRWSQARQKANQGTGIPAPVP